MVILKSIGAFFVKIWHWIKETAWVQPLLIVGAIFAVIFSIPYITEWVGGWTGNGAGAFYEASLLTLEGQTLSGDVTAADRFANVLEANEEKIAEGKYDEIDTESYGEKFFFVVWKEDCTACETAESGLRYLSDNWGYYDLIPAISGESFKMYTTTRNTPTWAPPRRPSTVGPSPTSTSSSSSIPTGIGRTATTR